MLNNCEIGIYFSIHLRINVQIACKGSAFTPYKRERGALVYTKGHIMRSPYPFRVILYMTLLLLATRKPEIFTKANKDSWTCCQPVGKSATYFHRICICIIQRGFRPAMASLRLQVGHHQQLKLGCRK